MSDVTFNIIVASSIVVAIIIIALILDYLKTILKTTRYNKETLETLKNIELYNSISILSHLDLISSKSLEKQIYNLLKVGPLEFPVIYKLNSNINTKGLVEPLKSQVEEVLSIKGKLYGLAYVNNNFKLSIILLTQEQLSFINLKDANKEKYKLEGNKLKPVISYKDIIKKEDNSKSNFDYYMFLYNSYVKPNLSTEDIIQWENLNVFKSDIKEVEEKDLDEFKKYLDLFLNKK